MRTYKTSIPIALAVALWLSPVVARAQTPVVLDLGTLSGDGSSMAAAINASGQVAGYSQAAYSTVPELFLWLPAPAYGLKKGMNDLGNLGGLEIGRVALNDLGQVAGSSRSASGWTAFLWLPSDAYGLSAGLRDIGVPEGYSWISIAGINSAGQIAATGTLPDNTPIGKRHALLWQNGVWTDLQADLPGITWSDAVGINESGQIPINAYTDIYWSFSRAYVWQQTDGQTRAFELLGPEWAGCTGVSRINAAGQISGGLWQPSTGRRQPCIWDAATGARTDPTQDAAAALEGAGGSAINSSGQVAATRREGQDPYREHILIWDPATGSVTDLSLPWLNHLARGPLYFNAQQQVAMTAAWGSMPNYRLFGYIGSASTGMQEVPGGYHEGVINGLNDAGEACGQTWIGGGKHAILVNPDQTPPVLSGVPADLTVEATDVAGSVVTWAAPTAQDSADGATAVSCSPPSGSTFALGTTTVDVSASDIRGNTATASFTVTVTYAWSGFLRPIDPPNAQGVSASIFKAGSVVPVRFALTGASAGITDAVATLSYAQVSDGVVGSEIEADANVAASTGNRFRYDATTGQYIYNWSTKGLSAGSFQLTVDMGDGVSRTVIISLK